MRVCCKENMNNLKTILAKTASRRTRLFRVFFVFMAVVASLTLLTDGRRQLSLWLDQGTEDNIRLYRDLFAHERWPAVEGNRSRPGQFPSTVHYIWCGTKQFRFQHYLGLLSAVRILQPVTLVFHYTHMPVTDELWYNTWFQELKQSMPVVELQPLYSKHECGSAEMLNTILGFLSQNGGIFLGENVLMTRMPTIPKDNKFWFAFSNTSLDVTKGTIFASEGFDDAKREDHLQKIISTKPACVKVEEFKSEETYGNFACVMMIGRLYPRDIWDADTPLAELSRWLCYGERAVRRVKSGKGKIPRISHYVWLNPNHFFDSYTFQFLHYLSVLSALHVGGFEHVFVHGEAEPEGTWWERLKGENVTFVKLDRPDTVFQQSVQLSAHVSDIVRVLVLNKYGGVYQDRDVIWTSRVPDSILSYPTVATLDWPRNGEWPETFNLGVLMSRRQAPWLRHFLSTLRYYRDDKWGFNACFMSYKAYEWHPESLYVDRRGQTICFRGICHPTWHNDYIRDIDDTRPVKTFNWRDGRALHFTLPKPPPSLLSPKAIAESTDMYAEVGRYILERSGSLNQLVD